MTEPIQPEIISSKAMLKVAKSTVIHPEWNCENVAINVLVLCPSQAEKNLFSSSDFSAYCFHCLEYSALQTSPPKLTGKVDLVAFCQDAIAYAQAHNIESVYYSFDITNLVAAVVCQTINLVGASLESVLQCFHKYYAREIDPLAPNYGIAQLGANGEIILSNNIIKTLRFPVFVKPVCSSYGMFCAKVDDPEQLHQVCQSLASKYKPWWQIYQTFFATFCNPKQYPLATTRQVPLLVEELMSGQPLTCDGFVFQGAVHFLGLVDTLETTDGAVDCYIFPSQVDEEQQISIYKRVETFVKDSGLNNSFFSAEFWVQENDQPILIEMNARMSVTFNFLYQQSLNFNLFKANLTLAQGYCPKIPNPRSLSSKTLPVSCRLYISTHKSGLASNLFDFRLAQDTLSSSQIITFNFKPEEHIQETQYHPTPLAELNLVGTDRTSLQSYGEHLRNVFLRERRLPGDRISVVKDCFLKGGEGLCYDPKHHQLFCLDYGEPQLIQLCLSTRKLKRFPLPGLFYGIAISAIGTVVLSGELGLAELNLETQELVPILQNYRGKPLVCNDVIVDPSGYLWFNTINEDAAEIRRTGVLLGCNLQGEQVQEGFNGLGYANGMGLSPDGRFLYLVDSLERAIHLFSLNSHPGKTAFPSISYQRKLVIFNQDEGVPDGLTVDVKGRLWLTFWFGGKVICINPQSLTREREIFLPAMNIASVTTVDSRCDRSNNSSCKLFACSSAVPWLGGKSLAPASTSDWPISQQGYLFEIDT